MFQLMLLKVNDCLKAHNHFIGQIFNMSIYIANSTFSTLKEAVE